MKSTASVRRPSPGKRAAVGVAPEPHLGYDLSKRLVDIVGAVLLLVIIAPLLIVVALGIKLTSRGPVLFGQDRCGLAGRRFRAYKFRSMREKAETELDVVRHLNVTNGPTFKAPDDPRVTGFGRFLRRSSLDELPQLWHVLRGEMSLVGPRPLDVKEIESLEPELQARHSVKPGLTCIWQVSGRSAIPFERWMEMDLEYVRRRGLWLDLTLIAKTVPVVLSGRGAY